MNNKTKKENSKMERFDYGMTQKQYYAKNKRTIIKLGHIPIKAQFDKEGNCLFCGEAGRCSGWHTRDELIKNLPKFNY